MSERNDPETQRKSEMFDEETARGASFVCPAAPTLNVSAEPISKEVKAMVRPGRSNEDVEGKAKTVVVLVERLGVPTMVILAGAVLLYLAGAWIGPNVVKPMVDSIVKIPDILARVSDTNRIMAENQTKQTENESKRQEWAAIHEQKFLTLFQLNIEKLDALKEEVRNIGKKLLPPSAP